MKPHIRPCLTMICPIYGQGSFHLPVIKPRQVVISVGGSLLAVLYLV